MEPTAEKNYSKLEWLFFMVIVPVLFITILSVILLWFLDYNVKEKILTSLNQIPVIEKLIPDSQVNQSAKQNAVSNPNPQLEKTIQELKSTLDQKNSDLKQLETDNSTKQAEIDQLKQQMTDLANQTQKKSTTDQTNLQEWINLAKVYSNMDPMNASSILANLNEQDAANILSQMSVDNKSFILEKMDPKKAASLSLKLKTTTAAQ
ncbi:MotE family protein [Tepidibacillus marianensis]|uniref:MotE family protein n=1 Tax=Tepidibacillus marianensis TaxID=3131995 RepID=UPI0030D135CA